MRQARDFDGNVFVNHARERNETEKAAVEFEQQLSAMREQMRQKIRELEGHNGGGAKGRKRKASPLRDFEGNVFVNHAKGRGTPGKKLAKQGRSKATQDRLIETAQVLFGERGYNGTSILDVLEKAKVNPGSMYYHFKTKDELLIAMLEKYRELLMPALTAPVWAKVSDPIERIFGLLAVYREAIVSTDFGYGCPIGRLAMEIDPGLREVHAGIAANFEGWSAAVQECLEAARSRLPKALDAKRLSRFVLTVMEGGVMQSRSYRSVRGALRSVRGRAAGLF